MTKLLYREWVTIGLLIGFLFSAALFSLFTRVRAKASLERAFPAIESLAEVHLVGEVKHPGIYHCSPGTPFRKLLKEAGGLTKHADRHQVDFKKVIYSSQTVEIPSKTVKNPE